MLEAIRKEFPDTVRYTVPEGGLFFWLSLPDGADTRALLRMAVAEKVSFVPGGAFYPDAARNNEMRLNFTNMSEADIRKGIAILGRITKAYLGS
jgi:2-aminoadipate transaminase